LAAKLSSSCHLVGSIQQDHANADIPSFHEIANKELQTDGSIMAHIVLPKHPMPKIPLTKSVSRYRCLYNEFTRSRRAVESMKNSRIWYVIADGGRARFVERDERSAFHTVASLVSTELHARSSDLGRDRPARVMESATPGGSAIEPRRD
jgi:hypothetical protein